MVAYLDSSLVLRHIILGDDTIAAAFKCQRVISSELLEIECKRVLLRYRIEDALDDEGLVAAMRRLEAVLDGLDLLELSSGIKKRAMEPFPTTIKTLDALHLATALKMAEHLDGEELTVYSYDKGMNLCAEALGFIPTPPIQQRSL